MLDDLEREIRSLKKWRKEQGVEYDKVCADMKKMEEKEDKENVAAQVPMQSFQKDSVVDIVNQEQKQKGDVEKNSDGMQGGGPPEEVIDACDDLDEGDLCEFTIVNPDGEEEDFDGECESVHQNDELICISEDMKGGMSPLNK